MKLFRYIFLILLILFTSKNILADAEESRNMIRNGQRYMPFKDVSHIAIINFDLKEINLTRSNLIMSSFLSSNLEGAILIDVRAWHTSFSGTILKGANLSGGNFKDGYFFDVNLENAIVYDASFDGVLGLTNEQKEYLRENGAINVPTNLSDEKFNQERLSVENSSQVKFAKFLDKFLNKIGFIFLIKSIAYSMEFLLDSTIYASNFIIIGMWKKIDSGSKKTIKLLKKLLPQKQTHKKLKVLLD